MEESRSRDDAHGARRAVAPTVPPLSRRRHAAYLAAPLLAFCASLAATEALVRLRLVHVSSLELFVTAPHQLMGFTDRRKVRIFEGDPLLFWRLQPNLDRVVWDFTLVSTNAQGIRHARSLRPKPEGGFRIVCLGDSVTFGYRVPLVFPERPHAYDPEHQPYPMLMERALRAANPGREVEVIALAVPGYSSHQGLSWLRREIDALQPDLVTACFGWNDCNRRARPDSAAMRTGSLDVTLRRIAGASQAVAHVALWLRERRASTAPPQPEATLRVPQPEFVGNLLEIASLARGRGAGVAVIGPVYRDAVTNPGEADLIQRHRAALRGLLRRSAVPYLEIPELTEAGHPANARLFGELIHPSFQGHRLLAGALLEFLEARGLLKGLKAPPPGP